MAANVSRRSIQLFYDVVSPYSWIAFEVLCRYKERWNLDLKLCPIFLGGIMKESGNKPPGVVPAKATYMMKDLERLRRFYGIPFKVPTSLMELMFANGTISCQRLLTATNMSVPDKTEGLTRELWTKAWSRDEDVIQEDGLKTACLTAGLSPDETRTLLQRINDKEVKQKLKDTTQEAIDFGAFGAPTIIAHKDGKPAMFFGSDRFELIADFYGVEWKGPLREETTSKL